MLSLVMSSGAAGAQESTVIEREAVQLRQPQRAAMLATAKAGQSVIAVGERGVALWSDDDGRHWHQAKVPVSVTLTAVSFADERSGWAVGHGAVVLHTKDAGRTWTRQYDGIVLARTAIVMLPEVKTTVAANPGAPNPQLATLKLLAENIADKPLLDVSFADAKAGFAVGAYGLVLRTQDGGATWQLATQKLDNPKALHLNTVRAQGRTVVIAGEQGAAYVSNDAGDTFRTLPTPYKGSYFSAAILPAGGVALAGLRGTLLVSPDADKNWSSVKLPTNAGLTSLAVDGVGTLRIGAFNGQIFDYQIAGNVAIESSLRGPPALATLIEANDGALIAGGLRGIERLDMPPTSRKP